jgi:hypothetical protein
MAQEFRVAHDRISDPNKITRVMREEFTKRGLKTNVHIATKIEDDPSTRERVVKVKNTRYFGNWSHRG